MATHRKQRANFFKRLTRKQAIGVIAAITAFALLILLYYRNQNSSVHDHRRKS